jgi:ribonuclease HII
MARPVKRKFEHRDARYAAGAIGVDEVNYSPSLAGDCVVAACWLPINDKPIDGIDDSKKLTHSQRLRAFKKIMETGVFTVVPASPSDIGHFGVTQSRNVAASLAVCGLDAKLRMKGMGPVKTVICDSGMAFVEHHLSLGDIKVLSTKSADATSYLVGAASIVAKVYLDAMFEGWNIYFPGYDLNHNHGSGSLPHYAGIRKKGPSPIHRVRNYGEQWWARIMAGDVPGTD